MDGGINQSVIFIQNNYPKGGFMSESRKIRETTYETDDEITSGTALVVMMDVMDSSVEFGGAELVYLAVCPVCGGIMTSDPPAALYTSGIKEPVMNVVYRRDQFICSKCGRLVIDIVRGTHKSECSRNQLGFFPD
jgi:hypothetical protein